MLSTLGSRKGAACREIAERAQWPAAPPAPPPPPPMTRFAVAWISNEEDRYDDLTSASPAAGWHRAPSIQRPKRSENGVERP